MLVVLPCVATGLTYSRVFGTRFASDPATVPRVSDFPGLERTGYRFPSDRGQMLQGYFYSAAGQEPRGIVVLAHGFGVGGHSAYMGCVNYFAQNGYLVFAYDATGNDESEGDGVGGFPQGVIDLDRAIRFVYDCGEIPELPVVLFGHSWGGYSAAAELRFHPEVKAVIEVSGFNRSTDLIELGGREMVGGLISLLMPYASAYERLRFGAYAKNTALDAFAASDAAVMAVHSADDDTVPIEYGYDLYYARYADDPRFTFRRLEDRGHSTIFYSPEGRDYLDGFNEDFEAWRESLPYAPEDEPDRFREDRLAYVAEHLDRARLIGSIDTALFEEMLAFYDRHIND